MNRVFHMLEPQVWQKACQTGFYQAESLPIEGFIHFSHLAQVERVANMFYRQIDELLLLEVDPELCSAQWKHEDSEGTGELFPHLYGPLNLPAIKRVHRLLKSDSWYLPKVLADNTAYTKMILFDIDSTLMIGSQTHKEAFQLSMKDHFNIEGSMQGIPVHGCTDPNIARQFLSVHGVDEARVDSGLKHFLNGIIKHFLRLGPDPKSRLLKNSEACLNFLKEQGILLGLVTGNLELIGWQKLMNHQIDAYFTFGIFSSDHPERSQMVSMALEKAAQKYKIKSNNVLLVGDSIYDVRAALDNNIEVLAVTTGKHTTEELAAEGAVNIQAELNLKIFEQLLAKIG